MIFKCSQCNYITDILCNYKRHYERKHSSVILPSSSIHEKVPQINEIPQNVIPIPQNVIPIPQNVIPNPQNVIPNSFIEEDTSLQCDKCPKIFSNKYNLKRHISNCKGKTNNLECYVCHTVFTNRHNRSRHMKECQSMAIVLSDKNNKGEQNKTDTVMNTNEDKQTTNNIICNQNNTVNNTVNKTVNNNSNNNSNNNTTINNFIISYKPDDIEFQTDHITNPELKRLLKITHNSIDDEKKVHMLEEFMRTLLTNPANKCVQKTNMQNCFSKVHTGNDLWQVKHDKDVYPKFTCNVAEEFNSLMVSRNQDTRMIKTERKLNELKAFLDYMADYGYRNDEDNEINRETHLMFKQLVQRIKGVVFEMTKIQL